MILLLRNGSLIDPLLKKISIMDIYIENGIFKSIVPSGEPGPEYDESIDAEGLMVAPGLIDMHVHLRDPGFLYKEDIESGSRAAICGGFTTIACMPNTNPVTDNVKTIEYILDKSKNYGYAEVLPIASVTKGQKGEELTDMRALKEAGAAAFSDDGLPVMSAKIMRDALKEAKKQGKVIISHCEDESLTEGGVMNEGTESERLRLKGRPAVAEEIMVARDAMLASDTGAHVHIAHVSTRGSVDIIRKAKASGVNITCETCPQYFTLTENEISKRDSLAKVNPPLRTKEDIDAIISGLADGTIDVIATDHAPHTHEEKQLGMAGAPSGIIGLETALSLCITKLYKTNMLEMIDIIAKLTLNPAQILNIEKNRLRNGSAADAVVFNPDAEWTVNPDTFSSKARNTPFAGMKLSGKIMYTIKNGKILYKNSN